MSLVFKLGGLLAAAGTGPHLGVLSAAIAFLFAQGAPIGYLLSSFLIEGLTPRQLIAERAATLVYIWVGTSFFFSWFGYVLGALSEELLREASDARRSRRLMSRTGGLRRLLIQNLNRDFLAPLSMSVEFLEGLKDESFGPLSQDQKQMALACYSELRDFYKKAQSALESRDRNESPSRPLSVLEILENVKKDLAHATIEWRVESPGDVLTDPEMLVSSLKQIINLVVPSDTRTRVKIGVTQTTSQHMQGSGEFSCFVVELSMGDKETFSEHISWLISKNIFELHGGFLWHDEDYSGGTRFYIAVPKTGVVSKEVS